MQHMPCAGPPLGKPSVAPTLSTGPRKGISSGCPMTGPAPAGLTRPSPASRTLAVAAAPFPVVWPVVACHAAWPRWTLLPGLASPRWPRRPESPVGQPREHDATPGSELPLVLERPGLRPEPLAAHPSGAGCLRGRRRWTTYHPRRTPKARAGGGVCRPLRPCLLPAPPAARGRHRGLAHPPRWGSSSHRVGRRRLSRRLGGREGRELREPSAHATGSVGTPAAGIRGPGGLPGNWARGPTGGGGQPPPPRASWEFVGSASTSHPDPAPGGRSPRPTPNCPIKGRHPGNLWED